MNEANRINNQDLLNSKWIKFVLKIMPANTAITVDPGAPTLTPKIIRYDPTVLKQIRNQHDHRYKVLPIEAIKAIRKLRLNRKRR